ncbi:hypothetical protein K8352_01850 [Flavobacteriaceae bacterium F89]|uniref:Uncharacterized protein n=1 Tax=Cerina litoralis TaxID=2874477 RepID=A0AAE3ETU3_9FLAO|nr:hypothetical protein [Cerina litoralis]MCG2459486.1 hypothetical protein [Cerina litoralis]
MCGNLFRKMTILTTVLMLCVQNSIWAQPTVTLVNEELKATFVDNSSYGVHKQGYNGISELFHKDQDSTLFVPNFAGVNLEHIFGGDSLVSLFEPRRQPMTIKRISDRKVLLHQPETSISKVESWTTFQLVDPHYIDVEFRFMAHDISIFNHGYIGLFWASYINFPAKLGINFKGRKKHSSDASRWIYAYSEKHGENGTHIGHNDTYGFYIAPNFNVDLTVEVSEYVFTEPYYYGRFHNMVFAYLFEEPEEGVIRFSKSPSGAGEGRPAWDFQYILPNFEVGKEYSIKWRVVYKKWDGQKDIDEEYISWSKTFGQ